MVNEVTWTPGTKRLQSFKWSNHSSDSEMIKVNKWLQNKSIKQPCDQSWLGVNWVLSYTWFALNIWTAFLIAYTSCAVMQTVWNAAQYGAVKGAQPLFATSRALSFFPTSGFLSMVMDRVSNLSSLKQAHARHAPYSITSHPSVPLSDCVRRTVVFWSSLILKWVT